jgi:hypothetical protein
MQEREFPRALKICAHTAGLLFYLEDVVGPRLDERAARCAPWCAIFLRSSCTRVSVRGGGGDDDDDF